MIRKIVTCDECYIHAEHADGVVHARTGETARTEAREYSDWHRSKGRDICDECWDEGVR